MLSKFSFRSSAEYGCEGNSAEIQRLGCLREDRPHQQKDLKSAQSANDSNHEGNDKAAIRDLPKEFRFCTFMR